MVGQVVAMTIGDAVDLLAREVTVIRGGVESRLAPQAYVNRFVDLPNGWRVSIGIGTAHDCRNSGPQDPGLDLLHSPDCEVALFAPDGGWFAPHASGRQSWGRVPASDLLRIVDAVALYRNGGACPCPDCVRARVSGESA